jgi:hypothetical protein
MTDERNSTTISPVPSAFSCGRVKRDQSIDVCRLIAVAVIEHLTRCGWRCYRAPASEGPSF